MLTHDTVILAAKDTLMRKELCSILEKNYNILEAATETQLRLLLEQNFSVTAALMIDCKMTGENEVSTLSTLHEEGLTDTLPVLSIVHEHSAHDKKLSLDLGAGEVISYPFYAPVVQNRVQNIVALFYSKQNMQKIIDEQATSLHNSYEMMMDRLSSIIEYRNIESGLHVLRIRRFTKMLLEEVAIACPEYNLDHHAIRAIASASALHDIGKISIPDSILNKPGKLTDEEYEIMKTHSITGSRIIEGFQTHENIDYLRFAYNICRYHHERYDGGGYPDKLVGEQIPICAQVVGLVDAYDALTTDRVYKQAISYLEASNMIINGKCGVFSPKLIECFKHIRGSFESLARSYTDGHSPKSDMISAPLPAPKKSSGNSLHKTVFNYQALIHYFNATAMEIDLNTGLFHLVYDPHLDFACIRTATTLSQAMTILGQQLVHPDDRHLITEDFYSYILDFFNKGLRKSSRYYRIKGSDGVYRSYEATSIRMAADDPSDRKALFIWHRKSQAKETVESFVYPRISAKLDCRYDSNLSFTCPCKELTDLLGYDQSNLPEGLLLMLDATSRDKAVEELNQQLSSTASFELMLPLKDAEGNSRWFFYKGYLISNPNEPELLSGILAEADNICSKYQSEMHLLKKYRSIIEITNDILLEYDLASNSITFSDGWLNRFGNKCIFENASGVISDNTLLHPDDTSLLAEQIEALKKSLYPFTEINVRMAEKQGKYGWNRIRMAAQHDSEGRVIKILGLISDIDSEVKRSQELQEKSERDSLTKLYNKEAGRTKISQYLTDENKKKRGAMIVIDLDNFKNINDRFGHLFGDSLLMDVAATIQGMFRESDILVRIGGDEFLAFMTGVTDETIISARCNDLINSITSVYGKQTEQIALSCSIGVALAPQNGFDYNTLFQKADIALYQVKKMGKGNFRFYDETMVMPSHSAVNTHIDSNNGLGIADNSLTEYIFQRLYETTDIEGTVNSILELIGKQLNVSRVYVFENNEANTTCSNTFEWCNEGIAPQIDTLQDIDYDVSLRNFINSFDERGLMYCSDIKDLPDHIRDIVEPQGIRALLLCAMRDKGVFKGYVGIDECNHPRLWTKEQISLVIFLSQLVSVFILKTRAQARSEERLKDLKNVLEKLYAWVYVVDPRNYEIKFLNGAISKLAPHVSVGQTCYKALTDRDSPCPSCPMLKGENGGSSIIPDTPFGFDVKVTSSPINWEGHMEWMLTCAPFDKDLD